MHHAGSGLPTRRALLGAAAASVAAAGHAATPAPIATPLIAQAAGHIPVCPARTVRNGWGVCGHPGVNASIDAYADMLGQLRTRDLRVYLFQFGETAAPRLRALRQVMQANGLSQPVPHFTSIVQAYTHDTKTSWASQQPVLLDFATTGMLRAIEGPNEINGRMNNIGTHGPADTVDHATPQDFAANFRAWCDALAQFKQRNRGVLGRVTTVAPSLVISPPATFQQLPNVSGVVDVGNVHYYAGGGNQPNLSQRFSPYVGTFQNAMHWARVTEMGGGPIWLTECGATTSNNYARSGVSQAKYIANQVFDYFSAVNQRLFIYELIDGSSHPDDIEGNFGLFRHDRSPKPIVAVLAGLQDLLSIGSYDDPRNAADTAPVAPAFDPQRLGVPDFSSGEVGAPNCLVLPKSDGSTLLALWNEAPIDDGKGHDIDPAPRPLSLTFDGPHRFAVHDLLAPDFRSGLAARRSASRTGRGVDIALRGYPVVVELLPR